MNKKISILVGLAIIILLSSLLCFPNLSEAKTFIVKILEPAEDGMEVGRGMTAKGTASIPSGYYLWVLVHRTDFEDVWWPQSEGKIDLKTNEWKVYVTVGEQQDIGFDFEIAVIIVKENEHILLKNYRKEAMKSGVWRPIEIPPTATAPKIRLMKKVSH